MLLILGFATRVGLLAYGELQDRLSPVKYTDIDYKVFTDAAAFVVKGQSPYARSTYRYSPLLAWALVPNVLLHPLWGKALFCAADLLAAWLIEDLLTASLMSSMQVRASVACWLFNPFTVTISTRGSGEALVTVQILLLLKFLTKGRTQAAAVLLGLATHWRVYPIIYSLPILLWLPSACNHQGTPQKILTQMQQSVSWVRVSFAATAAATFLLLGATCYMLYGKQFLQEAYLYHGGRKDPRHNFSIYFYNSYLTYNLSDPVSWLAPVTQIVSTASLGCYYAKQLPFSMMLQTMAFVAFNKVCTAQYFVWWFGLLPLILPQLDAGWSTGIMLPGILWVLAQLHWLAWAYLLEFQGKSVHLQVWGASMVMFAASVHLLCRFIACTKPVLFVNTLQTGKIHVQ